MSHLQSDQDACKTAADVRRNASTVIAKRRESREPRRVPFPVILHSPPPRPQLGEEALKTSAIQQAICVAWEITRLELLSQRRHWSLVHARHSGLILARLLTKQNLCEIGRAFAKDHTTVVYAVNCNHWLRVKLLEEGLEGKTLPQLAARTRQLYDLTPQSERYGQDQNYQT
jgi:hypothetical protein